MRFWVLFLSVFLFAGSAWAQTAEDKAKIEDYLNSLTSMEARFVQTASNGNTAQGKLYIQKPNKIRMVYDDPVNVLIVGDGDFIIYNDKELDQVTHIDYKDIPAAVILGDKIKFDGEKLRITKFHKDAGSMTVTVEQGKKNDIGPITLTFATSPFELKQWTIVDPRSVEVTVSLYDVNENTALEAGLFKFKEKSKPGFR